MCFRRCSLCLQRSVVQLLAAVLIFCISAPSAWALRGADVAIYNDTAFPGGGAWQVGLQSIRAMLDSYGYSHEDVTPADVNGSIELWKLYKVFIVGGGWAGGYNQSVNQRGFVNIRKFVANGGGFYGICAGAYFASNFVVWKPDYHAQPEYYDYFLDLFKGTGKGPVLGIVGWNQPTGCYVGITKGAAMTKVRMNRNILPDSPQYLNILYYGGPAFIPSGPQASKVKIVARYQVPGTTDHNTPAMILFPYGKGKVFLSGPHPEISMNFVSCSFYYDTKTWRLMDSILSLLHPGLQAAEQ